MKFLLLISMFIGIGGFAFAQERLCDEKRKEFEAQKVAFFTKELDMSPAEAEKFWPIYNEMQKKDRGLEKKIRIISKELREAQDLKEEKYKEAILKILDHKTDINNIRKEYYKKMLLVLPASKVWKLSDAEHKFHRRLFDKLRREPSKKNNM